MIRKDLQDKSIWPGEVRIEGDAVIITGTLAKAMRLEAHTLGYKPEEFEQNVRDEIASGINACEKISENGWKTVASYNVLFALICTGDPRYQPERNDIEHADIEGLADALGIDRTDIYRLLQDAHAQRVKEKVISLQQRTLNRREASAINN